MLLFYGLLIVFLFDYPFFFSGLCQSINIFPAFLKQDKISIFFLRKNIKTYLTENKRFILKFHLLKCFSLL